MTCIVVKHDQSVAIRLNSGHEITTCPCCNKPFTQAAASTALANLVLVFGDDIPDDGLTRLVEVMRPN